jgi:DNA repair and recombination protein RAD52
MVASPGEQYASINNPFVPAPQRISAYTAQEIVDLQSKLDRKLGPQYISNRPGAGNKPLYYITAEKVINLANEVFGFNGWSSSIQNVHIDFVRLVHHHLNSISLALTRGIGRSR